MLSNASDRRPTIVEVSGEGSTFWEARGDCVRHALQQTMKQLVIAERRIEDDRVLRDSVLSTMNGYIDAFEVLSQTREGGSIILRARVTVSSTKIENFVLSTSGTSARVDAQGLLADYQRDRMARQSRTEIFVGLFDGFPGGGYDVSLKDLRPDPTSAQANCQVEIRINKEYLRSLKKGLQVLAHSWRGETDRNLLEVCFSDTDVWTEYGECTRIAGLDLAYILEHHQQKSINGHIAIAYPFADDYERKVVIVDWTTVLFRANLNHNRRHIVLVEVPRILKFSIPIGDIPDTASKMRLVPLFVDIGSGTNELFPGLFTPSLKPGTPEARAVIDEGMARPAN